MTLEGPAAAAFVILAFLSVMLPFTAFLMTLVRRTNRCERERRARIAALLHDRAMTNVVLSLQPDNITALHRKANVERELRKLGVL